VRTAAPLDTPVRVHSANVGGKALPAKIDPWRFDAAARLIATHDADGNPTALSMRFKQICDGVPDPLYGTFRWSRA
jgi:hypothetical protein